MDSTISLILILPFTAKGCSDTKCLIVPDLIHTGSFSPNSTMSYLIGNFIFITSYFDINNSPSLLNFLEINHNISFKEFVNITVVDLTEDKLLVYDDLIS